MPGLQIVVDTSVFVAALRSRQGASHRLILSADRGLFELNLSVPLVLEYEEAASRLPGLIPLTPADIASIIDYLCKIARHRRIHYLWRPVLKDPGDDMVLELAVAAGRAAIITFNKRHYREAARFGVRVFAPGEFLREIGEAP